MMFSNYFWAVAGTPIFICGHFRPILQAMQRHSKSLAFGQLGRAVFRQGLGPCARSGLEQRQQDSGQSVREPLCLLCAPNRTLGLA